MPFEKTALFIDGENLHYTAKALGFDVDFKRLLAEFEMRDSLLRSYYYTLVSAAAEPQTTRPLIDWLSYNGFIVVTKVSKAFDDGDGRRKLKRSIAIELAVDALELSKHIDHMVLFSGDGDYRAMVEAAQRKGVSVTVVSTMRTRPAMIADELRRQANAFLELNDLRTAVSRM
jgi:uncharacterized LabA/DUF88 family protein